MTDDNDRPLFHWMTGHKLLCERIDRHRCTYEQWAGGSASLVNSFWRMQILTASFYTPYWLDWLIKNNFISQMKHHAWQSLHERDAFDTEAEQISLCVQCNSTVYKRLAAVLSVWNRRHKFMFICLCLLRADSQVPLSHMGHRHFFSCWTSAACLPAA